ncbi:unnamed protein product [Leuciscus chuanchicus]
MGSDATAASPSSSAEDRIPWKIMNRGFICNCQRKSRLTAALLSADESKRSQNFQKFTAESEPSPRSSIFRRHPPTDLRWPIQTLVTSIMAVSGSEPPLGPPAVLGRSGEGPAPAGGIGFGGEWTCRWAFVCSPLDNSAAALTLPYSQSAPRDSLGDGGTLVVHR